MLCSEEELKLKDKSEGILILPPATPLGKPLAEILGRDDTILTFKLTANRGDCLSHFGHGPRSRGRARAESPSARRRKALDLARGCPIAIQLEAGEDAPQFYGCSIEGVKIGPSPAWVVKRLEALGSRSINNVVDATNLVMLELGHPMHAYDADRIEGKQDPRAHGREGEKLPLLDGTEVEARGTELVIADGEARGRPGRRHGRRKLRSPATRRRAFLECAEFNPALGPQGLVQASEDDRSRSSF